MPLPLFVRRDLKIEVTYHYHKPESGCIVVYNLGKQVYKGLKVSIVNDKEENFIFQIDRLLPKVGELLKYCGQVDVGGNPFCGSLKSVLIESGGLSKHLIPFNNKFTVSK